MGDVHVTTPKTYPPGTRWAVSIGTRDGKLLWLSRGPLGPTTHRHMRATWDYRKLARSQMTEKGDRLWRIPPRRPGPRLAAALERAELLDSEVELLRSQRHDAEQHLACARDERDDARSKLAAAESFNRLARKAFRRRLRMWREERDQVAHVSKLHAFELDRANGYERAVASAHERLKAADKHVAELEAAQLDATWRDPAVAHEREGHQRAVDQVNALRAGIDALAAECEREGKAGREGGPTTGLAFSTLGERLRALLSAAAPGAAAPLAHPLAGKMVESFLPADVQCSCEASPLAKCPVHHAPPPREPGNAGAPAAFCTWCGATDGEPHTLTCEGYPTVFRTGAPAPAEPAPCPVCCLRHPVGGTCRPEDVKRAHGMGVSKSGIAADRDYYMGRLNEARDERDVLRARLAETQAAARALVKWWPKCQSPRCSALATGVVVSLENQTFRCDECWAELGGRWMRFVEAAPLAALLPLLGDGQAGEGGSDA